VEIGAHKTEALEGTAEDYLWRTAAPSWRVRGEMRGPSYAYPGLQPICTLPHWGRVKGLGKKVFGEIHSDQNQRPGEDAFLSNTVVSA
jgi:hypothetical protein